MAGILHSREHNRALELPEIISGVLVLLVVLWEACFMPVESGGGERQAFFNAAHLLLCSLVLFNALAVFIHVVTVIFRRHMPSRSLWTQLLVSLASGAAFLSSVWYEVPSEMYIVTLLLSFCVGGFAILNILSYWRERKLGPVKGRARPWSPAVVFFTGMVAFVTVSALILLTPGAAHEQLSFEDAFFMAASATSITGLSSINISEALTPLGKAVILADIQIGAIGVMTFSYFVLIMVGKKLALRDSMTLSGMLDQEGVQVVPSLVKAVIFVTLTVELLGALFFYFTWLGAEGIPQVNLWQRAAFLSISSFCNAGLLLDSSYTCINAHVGTQIAMLVLMFAGTLGFGLYLEGLTRLRRRLSGGRNPLLWSTHSWLVLRLTIIITLVGAFGLGILGCFEPSAAAARNAGNGLWDGVANFGIALWNSVGRSAGFTLADLGEYGVVYKLFLCFLMFVGGNPAGTGGGVYAPVFALCVLEVLRVLRGEPDVVLHSRRIARNTVERAMATVVLSMFWIVGTTMLLLLLEPAIAAQEGGLLRLLFEEVSAYTTTGYSLGVTAEISPLSQFLISANMIFGRIGMFTFMMIFIRQREASPVKFPVTRLPLN